MITRAEIHITNIVKSLTIAINAGEITTNDMIGIQESLVGLEVVFDLKPYGKCDMVVSGTFSDSVESMLRDAKVVRTTIREFIRLGHSDKLMEYIAPQIGASVARLNTQLAG